MPKVWTASEVFDCLKDVTLGGKICLYTPEICEKLAPKINRILELKEEKDAILLAHSYVVPEIVRCVADFVGDSYGLSKQVKSVSQKTIVFAAVKFMAETAKLLNPEKRVVVPSGFNGCSLADSITGEDVKRLRLEHPDYAFMCYVNTTADVKAECDVCVTSSNVYDIAEKFPNDKIYFLPDKLMGKNLVNELKARGVQKTIKYWSGTCYVHEEYEPEMVDYVRLTHPGAAVLAHPECDPKIIEKTDRVGSTSDMVNYVKTSDKDTFFLLTECGLTSRLQTEVPNKKFVGTCTMCKYMKANSLDAIIKALEGNDASLEVDVDTEIQSKALRCLDAMFAYA